MHLSAREFWTVFHGMGVGAVYLLLFAGGFAGLWDLHRWELTDAGLHSRIVKLRRGMWLMAVVCWLTVASGTWIVYPWYRAATPSSPRSWLLADPGRAAWHTFGMEWKEHVSWLAPMLATAAAAIVTRYGASLVKREEVRRAVIALYVLAFAAAAVAGLFGAFINKVAPIL